MHSSARVRTLDEVRRMVERVREGLEARRVAREDAELLYGLNREFFWYARRAHRFPGSTSKAFDQGVALRDGNDGDRARGLVGR